MCVCVRVFVCLSVCLSTSFFYLYFTNFSVLVGCGRGSVVLLRRCNTLRIIQFLWITSCFHVMNPLARRFMYMLKRSRQRFRLDLRSLQNTNRKSYLASETQSLACWSDDRKCPKSCFDYLLISALNGLIATRLLYLHSGSVRRNRKSETSATISTIAIKTNYSPWVSHRGRSLLSAMALFDVALAH